MKPMRLTHILIAAALSSSLTACMTTNNDYFNPQVSTDSAKLTPTIAYRIANDIVAKLAEIIGPGTKTVLLRMDKSPFARALEEALRAHGYAIAFDDGTQNEGFVPLAYMIDQVDKTIMVRVSTSEVELARSYKVDGMEALPSSPVAVMRRIKEDKAP